MKIEKIKIHKIDKNEELRLRKVRLEWVEFLKVSIQEIGLQQPISVRQVDGKYHLVSGAHRLQAIGELGYDEIDAVVHEYDSPLDAELAQVSENLCRQGLMPFDRARNLYQLDKAYKKKYPELQHGGDQKSDEAKENQNAIIALRSEILEFVGLGRRTYEQSIAIWRDLSPASRAAIVDTWIADHQATLINLSKIENKEKQLGAINVLLDDDNDIRDVAEALAVGQGQLPSNYREKKMQNAAKVFNSMPIEYLDYALLQNRQKFIEAVERLGGTLEFKD